MKKIFFFFTSLFVSFSALQAVNPVPPFALITVPKAGSHLMMKTIYFLIGTQPIWHTKFPSSHYIPTESGYLYTHFCLSSELEADYAQLPKLKKIVLIRDLRDVALSMIKQIKKGSWPGLSHEERQAFLASSLEEQLHFVINYEYDVREIAEKAPNSIQVSLVKIANQAHLYSRKPDVLTIRYEDLVGPEGGGSREAQIEQMHRINDFLELHVTDDVLRATADMIYGDEVNPFGMQGGGFQNLKSTFNMGLIGRWKEYFNEEHKEAFKKKLGRDLIALGYEEDDNW